MGVCLCCTHLFQMTHNPQWYGVAHPHQTHHPLAYKEHGSHKMQHSRSADKEVLPQDCISSGTSKGPTTQLHVNCGTTPASRAVLWFKVGNMSSQVASLSHARTGERTDCSRTKCQARSSAMQVHALLNRLKFSGQRLK